MHLPSKLGNLPKCYNYPCNMIFLISMSKRSNAVDPAYIFIHNHDNTGEIIKQYNVTVFTYT